MDLKIKASTLSVVQKDSQTVHCYVSLNGEACNLTLRFDRGLKAELCGYPMDWGVHDTHSNYYDQDSPLWSDLVECDGVLDDGRPYVSAETEANILRALKRSLARQFRSKSWSRECTKRRQAVLLRKVQRAIESKAS